MNQQLFYTNTLWPEVAVVSVLFTLGHIFLGHFEERTSSWRKLAKYLLTLTVVCLFSVFFGRMVGFSVLGLSLLPVLFIHLYLLPSNGINGWTGEPKEKYYEFRGWDKNIFNR
ncbi:hypothetical protein NC796_15890 [Aliifodinibius sp. S!AR15-10]|uniref:hypothetical protein n=1 Tax=Aliifodinibius sp. S!AR15-10 TaxID=2950437 RepID=UPI00286530ED|nr:hypothetical protein [Aliifodinibius sp. S!AR15-10]MDR8392638.1 hypothetical protein [Aliifodinibius sp. S!AR15-10]